MEGLGGLAGHGQLGEPSVRAPAEASYSSRIVITDAQAAGRQPAEVAETWDEQQLIADGFVCVYTGSRGDYWFRWVSEQERSPLINRGCEDSQ